MILSNEVKRLLSCLLLVACAAGCGSPKQRFAKYRDAGDRYAGESKYAEAIVEYRRALQIEPKAGEIFWKLGQAYIGARDANAASGAFIRAADLLPDDSNVQVRAGVYLLAGKRFDEAKQRAEGVLKRDPKNSDALILLGNALAGLNDAKAGLAALEAAIASDPTSTAPYINLGLMQSVRGDLRSAESAFRNAVRVAPTSISPRLALSGFLWAANRPADAEVVLKDALAISPNDNLVNRVLGVMYVLTNRGAEAEPYLKAAVAQDPAADIGPRLLLSDFYTAAGRFDDAEMTLKPVANDGSAYGAVHIRLAVIAFQKERASGYRLVTDLLQRDPHNAQALLLHGRFLLADGRLDDAFELVKKATREDPGFASAYLTLGDIELSRASWEEAIKAYGEALRLQPASFQAQLSLARAYLNKGSADAAVSIAQQAVTTAPSNPLARLLLVRALLAHGETTRAESELIRLSDAKDAPAVVHAELGRLRLTQGKVAEAQRAFSRALELDPKSIQAIEGVISASLAIGHVSEARQRIEAELTSRPNDPALLLVAARVYEAGQDAASFERVLRRAIQADSSKIDAYVMLARRYAQDRRLGEAQQEFETAVKREPRSVPVSTMLGMVLQLRNQVPEAQKQYEQTLAVDPSAAVAANNLAWIYAEAGGDLNVALRLAQTARAALPDRPEVVDTLGWVYYKKGLSGQAMAAFRESVTSQPNNAVYLFHLGAAYAQAGQKTEARRSLENALKLNGSFNGADEARRLLKSLG